MATERSSRREILRKLVTLGPLAALAGAFGVNGAKKVEAQNLNEELRMLGGNDIRFDRVSNDYYWKVYNDPDDRLMVENYDPYGNLRYRALCLLDTGNVGVGTTNPGALLHVKSNSGGVVAVGNSSTSIADGTVLGTLAFTGDDADVGTNISHAEIRAIANGNLNVPGEKSADIVFFTGGPDVSWFTEAMRITRDGNIGIANNNPARRLDVTGDLSLTGDIYMAQGHKVIGNAQAAFYSS